MDTSDNNNNIIQQSGNARKHTSSPGFDSSAVFASTSAESSRFYYEYSSSTESIQVIRTPAHLPENGTASTRRVLVKRGQVSADLAPAAASDINGTINSHEKNAEHDTYIKQEEDDSEYYAASPNYNPTSSSFQFSPSPPPPPISQSESVQSVQEKAKTVPYARRALLQTARKLTLSDLESSGDEGGVGPPPEMAAHLEPGEGVSFHNSSGASGDAEEGERIETPPELSVFDKKNILGDEQDTASGEPEPAELEEQQQPHKQLEETSGPVFEQHEDEDAELRPRAVRLVYEENFTQEELDQSILSGPKRVIRQSPSVAIDGHDNNIQEDNELEEKRELQSDNQHQQNVYSNSEDTKESSSPESLSKQEKINLELPEDQQQDEVLTEPNDDDEESDGGEPLIQQRKTTNSNAIATTNHKEDYNKDSQERQEHEERRETLRQERLERERQTEQKLLHAVLASDEEFERARLELAERLARERETRERLQREEAERAQRRRETEAREQARLEAEQARIVAESQAFERRREEQRKRERELDRERERKRAADRARDAEKARLIVEHPVPDREIENNSDKQRFRWEEDELDFVNMKERDHFSIENQKFTEKEERDQELRVAQERADREHADRERAEQDNRERRFRESNWQSAALLERQLQRESQLRTETETDQLHHEQVRSKQEQQQRKRTRPSLTRTPLTRNKTTPKKTFSPQSPSQRLLQRRAIYPRIGGVGMNIRSAISPAPLQLSSETTASTSQRPSRVSDVLTSSMGTHNRSNTFSSASTDPDEAPNTKRPKLISDWTSSHWRRLYRVIVNELRMPSSEITATAETVIKTGTGIPLKVRTAFPEFDSRDIGFRLLALARTLAKNGPRARDLVLEAQKRQR